MFNVIIKTMNKTMSKYNTKEINNDINELAVIYKKTKNIRDFNNLYDNCNRYLINFLNQKFYNSLSPIEIEDVATDTMVKSYEKMDTFNPEKASFKTWVSIIARNLALYQIKINKRIQTDNYYEIDWIPEEADSQEFEQKLQEKLKEVKQYIEWLKEPMKTLMKEAYIEGKDQNVMARDHNLPLGSLKTYLYRGRFLVKRHIEFDIDYDN